MEGWRSGHWLLVDGPKIPMGEDQSCGDGPKITQKAYT